MESPASPVLLVACRVVDGQGSLAPLAAMRERLRAAGIRPRRLEIDSLRVPWDALPEPGRESFRSGCAPIMALARARALIGQGVEDAVEIHGREPLRSGYERAERVERMAVYPGVSVPEAYTRLAELQRQRLGLDTERYRALADALFRNYQRTARERGLAVEEGPDARACTALFRYSDCANPYVDFEGGVILASPRVAAGIVAATSTRLLAAAVETVPDGPEALAGIVGYDHLRRAYRRACDEAGVNFTERFRSGRALLEAYTCFPPVPLAFLLASGIAASPADLQPLLERHPITVTGGMNLAGAPWNNPALNATIVLHERLAAGEAALGLVHGNGGVGGYQGVALLAP